jgi:hypothetical protein
LKKVNSTDFLHSTIGLLLAWGNHPDTLPKSLSTTANHWGKPLETTGTKVTENVLTSIVEWSPPDPPTLLDTADSVAVQTSFVPDTWFGGADADGFLYAEIHRSHSKHVRGYSSLRIGSNDDPAGLELPSFSSDNILWKMQDDIKERIREFVQANPNEAGMIYSGDVAFSTIGLLLAWEPPYSGAVPGTPTRNGRFASGTLVTVGGAPNNYKHPARAPSLYPNPSHESRNFKSIRQGVQLGPVWDPRLEANLSRKHWGPSARSAPTQAAARPSGALALSYDSAGGTKTSPALTQAAVEVYGGSFDPSSESLVIYQQFNKSLVAFSPDTWIGFIDDTDNGKVPAAKIYRLRAPERPSDGYHAVVLRGFYPLRNDELAKLATPDQIVRRLRELFSVYVPNPKAITQTVIRTAVVSLREWVPPKGLQVPRQVHNARGAENTHASESSASIPSNSTKMKHAGVLVGTIAAVAAAAAVGLAGHSYYKKRRKELDSKNRRNERIARAD